MRKKMKILYLLILLLPEFVYAQQKITVKGTVTDESGEALIGVSVQVAEEKTVGTSTGINGAFSLAINSDNSLIFSYLGYVQQKIAVNGKTTLNVVLESDLRDLEEVVVIAYGTQKKVTITGAVTDISSAELIKSPTASMANAISGKLPGLTTIQYSGQPGADDPVMLIRGVNSLSVEGSGPLTLVDGVPRSFTQIDPNEVESISILKDASATAVYGVRGANGVILITTKRGEAGKPRFSFTSSYGIQQPTNFLNFTDSYQYATAFNASQIADNVAENDLKFSQSDLNHFKSGDSPLLYPSKDWISYVMKETAPQNQYNLNISGGGETTRYFISLGRFDQDGLFNTFSADKNANFGFTRYNYRANLDIDIGKISTLSLNLGGRTENRRDIGIMEGTTNRLFTYLMDTTPMSGAGIVDGKRIVGNSAFAKVVDRDGLNTFYGQGYRLASNNVLNLDLSYLLKLDFITKGLNFKVKGSYNSDYAVTKARTASQPTYMPVLSNPTDPNSAVVLQKNGDVTNLSYNESSGFGRNWYSEASFDYSRSFGSHNVTALLLYNQAKSYYPFSYSDIPTGYIGLVGRATYNYQYRYMLDFNVGYNGSENFAPGKRYGLFPSLSAGWVVTSEKFMENQHILTYLKLRYSYGLVGNDGGSRFLYIPGTYAFNARTYLPAWNFWYGGTYNFGTNTDAILDGAYQQSEGYPDVTWEKSTKQNFGVDLKTLGDRLGLTLNVFKEHREDILVSNSSVLPGPLALPSQQINHGIVDSHGYEIQLSWADKIGDDFRYSIAPNLTFSRNKIIEQLEVPQNYPWLYHTGLPVSQPFGYEFFGFYDGPETESAYKAKYDADFPTQMVGNLQPGDAVYVDISGDGRITADDKHAIGHPEYPEYTLGTNINLSYKGFDISMTWLGATNVSRYLGYEGGGSGSVFRPFFGPQQRSALPVWAYENAWREDNKDSAILPRFSFMSQSNNVADSKVWLVDASYLRLKNLEVGYNFPSFGKLKFIKGLRIYANGSNLLTYSYFKGNDPENNGRIPNYPQMKVYNFGLRIDF
ncbi:MAG: TonB-dependent receptor [Dysgonamonadaceae bacterium]|jgi:TonB-linked SusC/RagA family outer membrane protein|nr:TonB-dependent receptor [Dysgonamonadaceae bacterium]